MTITRCLASRVMQVKARSRRNITSWQRSITQTPTRQAYSGAGSSGGQQAAGRRAAMAAATQISTVRWEAAQCLPSDLRCCQTCAPPTCCRVTPRRPRSSRRCSERTTRCGTHKSGRCARSPAGASAAAPGDVRNACNAWQSAATRVLPSPCRRSLQCCILHFYTANLTARACLQNGFSMEGVREAARAKLSPGPNFAA